MFTSARNLLLFLHFIIILLALTLIFQTLLIYIFYYLLYDLNLLHNNSFLNFHSLMCHIYNFLILLMLHLFH
jgi:hypothetical protein